MILADTNVVLDFFGGGEAADETENILNQSRLAISVITIYELFNGVTNQRHIKQRENLIGLCEVVDLTAAIARKASDIYTSMKNRGQLICHEDILIGASAIHHRYPLFTLDQKHFQRVPGMVLHQW